MIKRRVRLLSTLDWRIVRMAIVRQGIAVGCFIAMVYFSCVGIHLYLLSWMILDFSNPLLRRLKLVGIGVASGILILYFLITCCRVTLRTLRKRELVNLAIVVIVSLLLMCAERRLCEPEYSLIEGKRSDFHVLTFLW